MKEEFDPEKEADRVSDILIKTIFPMETENKGNKTPEEYLNEWKNFYGTGCVTHQDALEALALCRNEYKSDAEYVILRLMQAKMPGDIEIITAYNQGLKTAISIIKAIESTRAEVYASKNSLHTKND